MARSLGDNLGKLQTLLRKPARVQLPQRRRALQAHVVIGVVPQAVAQHGENVGVRRTGWLFPAESTDEEIDSLHAPTRITAILQPPHARLPHPARFLATLA